MSIPDFTTENIFDWYLQYQSSSEFIQELEERKRLGLEYPYTQTRGYFKMYVYVILCPPNYYKIGIAHDVKTRFVGIQTSNPLPLELVHVIPCDDSGKTAENRLHRLFKKQWFRGEWYVLTEEHIAHIKSLHTWRQHKFHKK